MPVLRCNRNDCSGSKTGPSRRSTLPIADIIALIGSAAKADIARHPVSAMNGLMHRSKP
jgi:hypothetical protein